MTRSLFVTPEEASHRPCPLVRCVKGQLTTVRCQGPKCLSWRWKPDLHTDEKFKAAINREIVLQNEQHEEQTGKKRRPELLHKDAVAAVMRDPEGHGIERTEGYCGMAGLPT